MTDGLNLVDAFWTIQGEGLHAGRRALFVRMPYCNLACSWCDTEFNKFKTWSEADFVKFAGAEPSTFAVITGGEPMLNKHTPRVIQLLGAMGFEIACESNGTFPILGGVDFATVSPKRQTAEKNMEPYFVHPQAMQRASEFKYVVDAEFDFGILKRHNTKDGKRYSLSPEFNNMAASLEKIIAYVKENPAWRISLQTHKFMNVP